MGYRSTFPPKTPKTKKKEDKEEKSSRQLSERMGWGRERGWGSGRRRRRRRKKEQVLSIVIN